MIQMKQEFEVIGDGEHILIISTGIGCSYYDWYTFAEKIKNTFTVILFHRLGYGNTSPPVSERTTLSMIDEFNNLLTQLEISKKFILLGHSFGGLFAQHFMKVHPEMLNGVVLVDSTTPDYKKMYNLDLPVMNKILDFDDMTKHIQNFSEKTESVLRELFDSRVKANSKVLTSHRLGKYIEFITDPKLYEVIAEEFKGWDTSGILIKNSGSFPVIPVKVIARDPDLTVKNWIESDATIPKHEAYKHEEMWQVIQKELTDLCVKGEYVIAENSDHEIFLDRPDVIIRCLMNIIASEKLG